MALDLPTILALTDADVVVGMDPFVERVYFSRDWRRKAREERPGTYHPFAEGVPLNYEELIEKYLGGRVFTILENEFSAPEESLGAHLQLKNENCPSQRNHVYRREIYYEAGHEKRRLILYSATFPEFIPREAERPSMVFGKGMCYGHFSDEHKAALRILPVGGFFSVGDLGDEDFSGELPESYDLIQLPEGHFFQKVDELSTGNRLSQV